MIASLRGSMKAAAACAALLVVLAAPLMAQVPEPAERAPGGEAALVLPPLDLVDVGGYNGRTLLMIGIGISLLGMVFGLVIFTQLKNLPVHRSMREISELIYETCKTYLITQGKFIMVLWLFIGAIAGIYFGFLAETVNDAGGVEHGFPGLQVIVILLFSLVGLAGSYRVAWFGIRVN